MYNNTRSKNIQLLFTYSFVKCKTETRKLFFVFDSNNLFATGDEDIRNVLKMVTLSNFEITSNKVNVYSICS
jgi:hypothetical protein